MSPMVQAIMNGLSGDGVSYPYRLPWGQTVRPDQDFWDMGLEGHPLFGGRGVHVMPIAPGTSPQNVRQLARHFRSMVRRG